MSPRNVDHKININKLKKSKLKWALEAKSGKTFKERNHKPDGISAETGSH